MNVSWGVSPYARWRCCEKSAMPWNHGDEKSYSLGSNISHTQLQINSWPTVLCDVYGVSEGSTGGWSFTGLRFWILATHLHVAFRSNTILMVYGDNDLIFQFLNSNVSVYLNSLLMAQNAVSVQAIIFVFISGTISFNRELHTWYSP